MVALAMIDRFISNQRIYFDRKIAIRDELHPFLTAELHEIDHFDLDINTLDQAGRGLGGMSLTVFGASGEGADEGQVGHMHQDKLSYTENE